MSTIDTSYVYICQTMIHTLEIGNRIKTQREYLGFSREELAEKADITPRFCYDLELGLKEMSVPTLIKLCDALKINCDYLLFGDSSENQELSAGVALMKACPPEKRKQLNRILSAYIDALK